MLFRSFSVPLAWLAFLGGEGVLRAGRKRVKLQTPHELPRTGALEPRSTENLFSNPGLGRPERRVAAGQAAYLHLSAEMPAV